MKQVECPHLMDIYGLSYTLSILQIQYILASFFSLDWIVIKSSLWHVTTHLRHLSKMPIKVWHSLPMPSETPPPSCMCQQKHNPPCQAAPPSHWIPLSIPHSIRSQGQQVSPNCMLIRAARTSLWLLTIDGWHQGIVTNAKESWWSKQGGQVTEMCHTLTQEMFCDSINNATKIKYFFMNRMLLIWHGTITEWRYRLANVSSSTTVLPLHFPLFSLSRYVTMTPDYSWEKSVPTRSWTKTGRFKWLKHGAEMTQNLMNKSLNMGCGFEISLSVWV